MTTHPWLVVFCYSIVAYGASNVIVFGSGPFKVFEKLREWSAGVHEHFGQLFSCMMCLPANFGWICSLVNRFVFPAVAFTPFNIIFNSMENSVPNILLLALCDGAFTTGIVWIIHHIEEFFENLGGGEAEDGPETIVESEDITLKD